jgi:hypothetical protein
MPRTSEPEISTESLFEVARHLPREGRIVLIEKLAASLLDEKPVAQEAVADAERRWAELESGTAKPASMTDLENPLDSIGMREEDWPDTPETRAEVLRRMEAVEPLELTAEDEARIASARAEMKAKSIEAMRQLMGLQP